MELHLNDVPFIHMKGRESKAILPLFILFLSGGGGDMCVFWEQCCIYPSSCPSIYPCIFIIYSAHKWFLMLLYRLLDSLAHIGQDKVAMRIIKKIPISLSKITQGMEKERITYTCHNESKDISLSFINSTIECLNRWEFLFNDSLRIMGNHTHKERGATLTLDR